MMVGGGGRVSGGVRSGIAAIMAAATVGTLLLATLVLGLAAGAMAAECGDSVPCQCGDTVGADYLMTADLGPCPRLSGEDTVGLRVRPGVTLAVEPLGDETHPRAGLLEDVAEFGAVQLGVGRHRGQSRVPDRVQHFDIVRTVPGDDGDAVAGVQAETAERTGEPRHPAGHVAVVAQHPRAKPKRRAPWIVFTRAFKEEREIHVSARPR
jgi:hypothetical protein